LPEGASDYVKSKFEGEAIAAELAARGAPVMIAHPAAPVGPWDRVPTVTGERIIQVLRGKEPRYGVAAVINHVPVRDVALGAILAAERGSPGRHYLLASANGNLSEKDLVDLVTLAAGLGPRRPRGRLRRWFGRRGRTGRGAGAPATLACDPSGSVQELGLPQSPLAEAFREAVEWFRRHGYVS
jgi:dihydroflavonol-4-reductase